MDSETMANKTYITFNPLVSRMGTIKLYTKPPMQDILQLNLSGTMIINYSLFRLCDA